MTPLLEFPPDDPDARCKHCGRLTDLIQHDGPVVVCTACVREMTEFAADPHGVDTRILSAILDRHGDVLKIGRTLQRPSRLIWEWIGWP